MVLDIAFGFILVTCAFNLLAKAAAFASCPSWLASAVRCTLPARAGSTGCGSMTQCGLGCLGMAGAARRVMLLRDGGWRDANDEAHNTF